MTQDIKVDLTPPSRDDEFRKELLWESRDEKLLEKWKNAMSYNSEIHGKSGKIYKILYAMVGVPAILIPIVLSGLTSQFEDYPLAQSFL